MGEKRNSHAITEEYAKADPIYVAKTAVSRSAFISYICTNGSIGITAEVLALSARTRGWELWMAGYVLPQILQADNVLEKHTYRIMCTG